jgi:hypothetical protein
MSEKDVEDLICRFPGLFGVPEDVRLFARQHVYPTGKVADIVFRSLPSSQSIVFEIKDAALSEAHLDQ